MSDFVPSLHTSYNTFDRAILEAIRLIQPKHVLDIGAGGGKYGKLIRETGVAPDARLAALEIDPTCAEPLSKHYDQVRVESSSGLYGNPGETFDTILMGDVLEHHKVSEGLDLLHYLVHRSRYIMIVVPEAMPMSIAQNFYLGHNSVWRPEMFNWYDNWAHARVSVMRFYILRGYLDHKAVSLASLCAKLNAMGLTGNAGGGPEFAIRLEHVLKPVGDVYGDNNGQSIYRAL